jgi:hypothetical protein
MIPISKALLNFPLSGESVVLSDLGGGAVVGCSQLESQCLVDIWLVYLNLSSQRRRKPLINME